MTMREQLEFRAKQQGIEQGMEKKAETITGNAVKQGADVDFVAKITGLTLDQVNALKAKIDS